MTVINLKAGKVQNSNDDSVITVRNIFRRSGTEFITVSKKLSIPCGSFLKAIQGKQVNLLPAEKVGSEVVLDSDLLADISALPAVAAPPKRSNILSGVFGLGILFGVFLCLVLAVVALYLPVTVGIKELVVALVSVSLLGLTVLFFVLMEPRLKDMQKKHEERIGKFISRFLP